MPAQLIVESLAIPETYAGLRRSVETLLFNVRQLIEEATVRTYWETGRLISGHLHLNEYRPRYGSQTIRRLAADLSISETVLYRCVRFFDCFANLAARPKLLWAHYRVLITVADPAERAALERTALDEELTSPALAARVQQLRLQRAALPTASATDLAAALLTPKRSTPGLHLIVEKTIGLSVDLGFRHYWPLTPEQAKRFAKGDIVRIASDDSLRAVTEATKADLFAYAATLVRVVDGDTLVVALEISPGEFLEQKLRLRGLDAPEMSTPEGKAAKRFVDTLVAKTTSIVIRTTKPDKYDRYLADVFLIGDFSQLLATPKPGEDGATLNSSPHRSPSSRRSPAKAGQRSAPLFTSTTCCSKAVMLCARTVWISSTGKKPSSPEPPPRLSSRGLPASGGLARSLAGAKRRGDPTVAAL